MTQTANAAKLAKDHGRHLSDARHYLASGDAKAAARRTAAACRIEAALIEAGHRELVGHLTERAHLIENITKSEVDRPELRGRLSQTMDRIFQLGQ